MYGRTALAKCFLIQNELSHTYLIKIFKIGCRSVHQLYRIRITAIRIKIMHGTFVTSIPIRTLSEKAYSHSSRYPIIHIYRPFEIGCTSVHQPYRIRITTKRIEKVHGTFVSSIPIRAVSFHAQSHRYKVSHNTYVPTV